MGTKTAVRVRRAAVLVVAVAAAVLLAAPAGALATMCELNSGLLDVTLEQLNNSASMGVGPSGEIIVSDQDGLVNCTGGPTVNNTNTISVHNSPLVSNNDVTIYESDKFAPGKTVEAAEAGGTPEIEIYVNLNDRPGSELNVDTPFAGGTLVFGSDGINPNASLVTEVNPDVDIFPNSVPQMTGRGNPGPDFISAAGGRGTGAPLSQGIVLSGGAGEDTVGGGEGADVIQGNSGRDQLAGNGGNDVIDGSPGDNVFLSGGAGDDHLYPGSAGDSLNGGDGTDDVSFVLLSTGAAFDLDGSQTGIENLT
jgi:Ca2+-binding RTX toxin-like protein